MLFKKFISGTAITALMATMLPVTALAATGGVDLVVQDIYMDSSGLLTSRVANEGDTDVSSDAEGHTYYYVGQDAIDADDATYTYSWTTISDTSFFEADGWSTGNPMTLTEDVAVKVCIDPNDVVDEVDDDNNCLTVELQLEPQITIDATTATEYDLATDAELVLDVDVDGASVTEYSDHLHYYMDDDSVIMDYDTEYTFDLTALELGEHTVTVILANHEHTEYTHTGATDTLTFTLEETLYPDLLISDISIDEDGKLSVVAANEGDAEVEAGTQGHTYVYVDDMDDAFWTYSWTTLGDTSFMNLAGSSTIEPGTLSEEGTYAIKACIDPTEVVEESDEDNNCLEVEVKVEGPALPDLVVDDIYLDGSTLTVLVQNESDVNADSDSAGHTYIYIGQDSIDNDDPDWTYSWTTLSDTSFLEAEGSATIQPQTITEDTTVMACVDPGDVVEEEDEDNNCITVDLDVEEETSELSDLVVDDIYLDGSTLTVLVQNESDVEIDSETAGSTYIYIGQDSIDNDDPDWTYSWTTLSDTSFLEAEGSATIQPQTITEDTTVMACVDAGDVVEEEDEDNNCITVDLDVDDDDDDVTDYSDEYDVDEDDVEETEEDVELDEETEEEFQEVWTDYPDTFYLTVKWGYQGEKGEQVDATDWSGALNFENMIGRPMKTLKFESGEDWIVVEDTNPSMIQFESMVHGGKDGLLFKVKADVDSDPEGYMIFDSYTGEEVEVELDELLAEGRIEFEYDDDYKVVFDLVPFHEFKEKIKDTILLNVRIGNLDGEGSEFEETQTYTVNLEVSDESVVRGHLGVLLEEHEGEYSDYDQLYRDGSDGIVLESAVRGHWDGFLALLHMVEPSDDDDRYVTVVVEDEDGDTVFSDTFYKNEDLGVFDLDDGTGNQIEITNLFENKTYLAGDPIQMFGLLHAWHGQLHKFASVVSDLLETGELDDDTADTLRDILDELISILPTGEDVPLDDVEHDISSLTRALQILFRNYEAGNVDDLDEMVDDVLGKAKDQLDGNIVDAHIAGGELVDVDHGAWYANHMDNAINNGFFGGYQDADGNPTGHMGPGDNLTRLQLIKIMYELSSKLDIGVAEDGCEADSVELTSEVDWMDGHWSAGYVQCIYNSGYELTVLDDIVGEYLPNGTTNALRWEVMATGFEMLGVNTDDYSAYSLSDLEGSELQEDILAMIQEAIDLGIISGYPDGTFGPYLNVNRAEMFKIVSLFDEVFSLS